MDRRFCSVCLCIVCLLAGNGIAVAMAPEYRAGMHDALLTLYYEHPEYKLGGSRSYGTTDCSELIRQAMNLAGIPGTKKRVQAWSICKGLTAAYRNAPVLDWRDGDTEACDIVCQYFPDGLNRPYGINHIIAVVQWNGVWHVIHASSSKKRVVITPFASWIEQRMIENGYRRFTIGDVR